MNHLDILPHVDLFMKDGGTWIRDKDKEESLAYFLKRRGLNNR